MIDKFSSIVITEVKFDFFAGVEGSFLVMRGQFYSDLDQSFFAGYHRVFGSLSFLTGRCYRLRVVPCTFRTIFPRLDWQNALQAE